MGLNCGCPAGAHIADLTIQDCKESMGQVQKVIFQRLYSSTGTKNTVADFAKATLSPLFAAADGTKMVISPYIQNPTTEPGAARTFGGGNQTLGGIEHIIGREPTTFSGIIYQESQVTIAQLKELMCEKDLGVYLIDENGAIGAIQTSAQDSDSQEIKTVFAPIPIGKLFIGDKKLGGYEEPDSNTIEWSFFPNWSDHLVINTAATDDYNPLTDLVNVASAGA